MPYNGFDKSCVIVRFSPTVMVGLDQMLNRANETYEQTYIFNKKVKTKSLC